MNATSLLQRQAVKVEAVTADESDGELRTLATEAREKLGYRVLESHLEARKAAFDAHDAVARAMEELQIFPYTAESVAEYKRQAKEKAEQPPFLLILATSAFALGFLQLVAWLVTLAFASQTWLMIAGILLLGLGLACCLICDRSGLLIKARWLRHGISSYPRPIPEFALQSALDLKTKCPGLDFFVDEMQVKQVVDPFLVAVDRHGNEYFLEVWNE
ncbi:MAG: hypothetical protein ABR915_24275, partial [Thermoguttaceae bacterium]